MKLKLVLVVVVGWALTIFCFSETMLKPKFLFEFGHLGTGNGEFLAPKDVTLDFDERIYVLDNNYYRGLKIEEGIIAPEEIFGEYRVQVFSSNGVFSSSFGSPNFVEPYALAIGRLGNIYVTDVGTNCVHIFNTNFQYIGQFGSLGSGDGQLNNPGQIAVGEMNNVYVVDRGNQRVAKFNSAGGFITNFPMPGLFLEGIAPYTSGLGGGFYLSGTNNVGGFIKTFSSSGDLLGNINRELDRGFVDIAVYQGDYVMGSGYIWEGMIIGPGSEDTLGPINYAQVNSIYIYTTNNYLTKFGSTGKQPGQFYRSQGLATNPNGRDKLYVADYGNQRVQVFTFEIITNFSSVPPGSYSSGDFDSDGLPDIIVDRQSKQKNHKANYLQVKNGALKLGPEISAPLDFEENELIHEQETKPQVLVGNSMGVYSALVFQNRKKFSVANYWVDKEMTQNELQGEKDLPVPFTIGHVRASGDVNKDGILDIVLTKKQRVSVLLGPNYSEVKPITGLPTPLPGRVRAMYHEGTQDSVLVFQKGKGAGRGYFIGANFVAIRGPKIVAKQRIRAMAGSKPVTQKKRKIKVDNLTYKDLERKTGKLRVIGPR